MTVKKSRSRPEYKTPGPRRKSVPTNVGKGNQHHKVDLLTPLWPAPKVEKHGTG